MNASPAMIAQAGSLVRRWRAGDENAGALLTRIGQEAKRGNARAHAAFAAVAAYVAQDPAQPYALVKGPPIIMSGEMVRPEPIVRRRVDPELLKPPLPRGALNGILDPEVMPQIIVHASQFRHGLKAAAAALAAGPPLTADTVRGIGQSAFGSEDRPMRAYLYGVQFCGEDEWRETAPALSPGLRKCLAVGQCIGRARRLQAVRHPRTRISSIFPVAGWELGE